MDGKKPKTHILILDDDDPEREIEFEIKFQLSLLQSLLGHNEAGGK